MASIDGREAPLRVITELRHCTNLEKKKPYYQHPHPWHFPPVEEPSTASTADIAPVHSIRGIGDGRYRTF
jgi:hypothetical protein